MLDLLRYERSARQEVFAFLRSVSSTIRSDRLIQQWDWKYDTNPFNREAEPYVLLLKDGVRIIGMLGAISLPVSVHGQPHWGGHAGDLVVHPDYRGRGVSRQLITRFEADHRLSLAWLNPISRRATAPVTIGHIVRVTPLVRVLDVAQVLRRVTSSSQLARWAGLVARGAGVPFRCLRRDRSPPDVTITSTISLDQRFDALWESARGDCPVSVARDRRYLHWRFGRRPDADYEILIATRGPDLVGYMIYRWAERAGLRSGHLVDFLVERRSPTLLAPLVREAMTRLRREGAAVVTCLATRVSYRHALYRQGLWPWRWGTPWYFASRADVPDPALRPFQDARQWFLTMGDGDVELGF